MRLGDNTFLSDGEIAELQQHFAKPNALKRAWDNWVSRCGAHDLW
jgi:hypothetical protein